MRDLFRDLKEVIKKGAIPEVRKAELLRQARLYEKDMVRAGVNVNKFPQIDFCAKLKGETPEEWMFRLCTVRLLRGDYSDWSGWEYRNEWATASYWPGIKKPRWRLEQFHSIAILGEQGAGDEIMFSSCIPDLLKLTPPMKVTLECEPRLQKVFERSFGVETKPRIDIVDRERPELVKYLTMDRPEACFLPIGDLPRFFRKSRESFPGIAFLKPLPEMVEKWKCYKGRTGFAWRGRTGQIRPRDFKLDNPVCLQYDAWEEETEGMEVPEIDLRNDVEDILGICANLARVVTVGQTIVHLAASIGTPVEIVRAPVGSGRVMNAIHWRYGEGTYPMPWYSQARVHKNLEQFLYS